VVDRAAALYTDYLRACRQEGLSLVQPGRFLMPGDPSPDPGLLRFSPLSGGGPLATEMARRYDLYLRRLVEPFFRDHFRHFDRQIVLIDVLSVLNRGYDAFIDAERALAEVLRCFRYGSSGFLSGLFGARIGKILFAATKADHITVNQYHNLRLLVEAMATIQGRTDGLTQSDTGFGLVAALKSTEGALLRFQGRAVEALRGIPLGQDREQVLYPGEIPAHHPTPADWAEDRFRFVDFAPRRSGDPRREGLRSIHLDKALEFLIGDRFR
jgi:predicted YcjX-like family ATPase